MRGIGFQHRRGSMPPNHDKNSDPLYAKYQVSNKIGFGSYGIVYDATCRATGIAKAIKGVDPNVRKSGSDSVEIEVLQKCNHPNVIRLDEVIDVVPGRDVIAIVFPAYDTDLSKLLRLRRGFPDEFPMQHRYCITKGIWNGLRYMHSIEVLHRDLKPANILIAFGVEVRAVLADMGLACDASKSKPNTVVGDDSGMQCHRTANVCTSAYVAPELLCAQHQASDTQHYGLAIDVWAAGAISLEIACLQRFCRSVSSPVDQFSDIVRRLGKPPKSFGRIPEAFQKVCRKLLSSTDVTLEWPWLAVIGMGIQWDPQERYSAKAIADYCQLNMASCSAGTPPAAEGASPAGEGERASDPVSVRASPRDSGLPVLLEASDLNLPLVLGGTTPQVIEHALPAGSTCACSGGCGQLGHRRDLCDRAFAVLGSNLCSRCQCEWLGCNHPRVWGKYCKVHRRQLKELSPTWQVVLAAGKLNCQLVPVDANAFCEYFDRHRTSFRECLTIAFVKEAQVITFFEDALGKRADHSKEDLRQAWISAVERIIKYGQDREALRNLTRQGVGRFSCLARTMVMIGILENVPKPSPGIPSRVAGNCFTLGLDNVKYRFCEDKSKFDSFYDGLAPVDAQWQQTLKHFDEGGQFDLQKFCKAVRSVLSSAAASCSALGLKKEGYCFDFAYRKFIIAEVHRRKGQVNWETSMLEIQQLSADSGKYLAEIETTVVSVAFSHAVFGRADWAIMLSCFACLWGEVVEKFVDTGAWKLNDLLEVLRSDKLTSFVAVYTQAQGFAPHPCVLFEIYNRSGEHCKRPPSKRAATGRLVKHPPKKSRKGARSN